MRIRCRDSYRRHWAMLLFLIFACIDTSIKLFPRKKSVATMLVSFHHSSWNLNVRFLLTESAICRSPPDKLKIMSSGYGVSSAITAHSGFWLLRNILGPMITSSRYLKRPSTVCWLPQAWDIVGHSQSYSEGQRFTTSASCEQSTKLMEMEQGYCRRCRSNRMGNGQC